MNTDEKVCAVIKRMATQPEYIRDLAEAAPKYCFTFKAYTFSIARNSDSEGHARFGGHTLSVYPRWKGTTGALADLLTSPANAEVEGVSFHAVHLPPETAKQLADLYDKIQKRVQGVEDVLDDILDGPIF